MHGPGRAAQARGLVPAGVPGVQTAQAPPSLARCRQASAFSLWAWLASSPHLRHPWRGLPKDSPQGFQPRTSRGPPGQVLAPQRLLIEPWPVLIEMSPPRPPPPPHPFTTGAKCKRFLELWPMARPEGASFQHLGLAQGLWPDLAPCSLSQLHAPGAPASPLPACPGAVGPLTI